MAGTTLTRLERNLSNPAIIMKLQGGMSEEYMHRRKRLFVLRGGNPGGAVGKTDILVFNHFNPSDFEITLCIARNENAVRVTNVTAPNLTVREIRVPKGYLGSIVANLRGFRLLYRDKPDLVLLNPGYAIAGAMVKLATKAKIILDIRSIPAEISGIGMRVSEASFYLMLNLPVWDSATYITPRTRDYLRMRAPRLDRIPGGIWRSGVDVEFFEQQRLDRMKARERLLLGNEFVVIYHGTLTRNRGVLEAVKAFSIVKKKGFSGVRFIIVGGGPIAESIRTLISELDLSHEVFVYDEVSYDSVVNMIVAADAGINPPPDLFWWRLSSSLKAYEYAAAGLLLILTKVSPHEEFTECGIFAEDSSPDSLAAAVIVALEMNENERNRRRKAAIDIAHNSTWKKRAEELSRFLKEVA